eukprot:scaffold1849_cov107-Isochrysis_galbana.AAC.16
MSSSTTSLNWSELSRAIWPRPFSCSPSGLRIPHGHAHLEPGHRRGEDREAKGAVLVLGPELRLIHAANTGNPHVKTALERMSVAVQVPAGVGDL